MKPSKIIVLVCTAALAAVAPGQFTDLYSGLTNLSIPTLGTGGAAGGASNPYNVTTYTVNVPKAVVVESLTVQVHLAHTAVGDLRFELSHCGTSVLLYDQSPASTANLNGTYLFYGGAATTFASAINAAGPNGNVAVGTYSPAAPLSTFFGMNSAGAWTITVYDLAVGNSGTLFGFGVTLGGYASYWSSATSSVPIPDGFGGECLAPVVKQIWVNSHEAIDDLVVSVALTHSYVSDLDVVLQHGGVSVTLSQWASPVSTANVGGLYSFWDGSGIAWTAVENAYSGTAVIPAGFYRPAQPLSAFEGMDQYGAWYLTVCDRSVLDTGTLGVVTLDVGHSPYDLVLSQPNGTSSIDLTNRGGVPGNSFVNLFTLAQGGAPQGWVAGLDIDLADLVWQVSFGPPFTGTLGPCGSNVVTVGGPIPSGLTVWGVSFELDATQTPVAVKPVFTYTTL